MNDLYAGFDLGNIFAYAVHDGTTIVDAHVWNLQVYRKSSLTFAYGVAFDKLCQKRKQHKIKAFAYERVLQGPHVRQATIISQSGYRAILLLAMAGRECKEVDSQTLKKFATDNSRATKQQMLKMAQRTWPDIPCDSEDQADAMWLAAYAAQQATAPEWGS